MYCMTYTVLRNRDIIIEREADSALGEPLAERRGDKSVIADEHRKGQMVNLKTGKKQTRRKVHGSFLLCSVYNLQLLNEYTSVVI